MKKLQHKYNKIKVTTKIPYLPIFNSSVGYSLIFSNCLYKFLKNLNVCTTDYVLTISLKEFGKKFQYLSCINSLSMIFLYLNFINY